MTDLVTLGETMALFGAATIGPLRNATTMTVGAAGAESNVAIALARLGVRVTWISRLGRDPFGDMIEDGLRAEGVDVSHVRRYDARTGLFLKWRGGEERGVAYYRAGSSASLVGSEPEDDDADGDD